MLQDIKGSDIFSDDSCGTGYAAGAVPGLSDAKKKALYSTSVFGQDEPSAAPQVHFCVCLLACTVTHMGLLWLHCFRTFCLQPVDGTRFELGS